jgi:precorrin-8X/cobalt-precorrin-8 methylmutase
MEKIILIGHGSPRKEANNVEIMAALLHRAIHPDCQDQCVKAAYMQFAQPDIAATIAACVEEGAQRIVVHPFFLYSGVHVTKDIPEAIAGAKRRYPGVEFVYTEPLGVHEGLVRIILERIDGKRSTGPNAIEKESFDIISGEADFSDIPADRLPIVKRVIHATADFEFRDSLVFHPDAVRTGVDAIRAGRDILTDVEMVRTGISKRLLGRWGGKVLCSIRPSGAEDGGSRGGTRAEAGIEEALAVENNIGIVAIGNAPTALSKVIELFGKGMISRPLPLVIGVPVGFVKALESKVLLSNQTFPFITNLGRKGGTPAAVAIVNALLKIAEEEKW